MAISRFPPHVGGAEVQCERLSRQLAARGHDVTVVTETPRTDLPNEAIEHGVRVVRLPNKLRPPLGSLLSFNHFYSYLSRQREADILHAHLLSANAAAAILAGRRLGCPVLVKIAGARKTGDIAVAGRSPQGRLKLELVRWTGTTLVGPAAETVEEATTLASRSGQVHQIPNGVDSATFHPPTPAEKTRLRSALGLSDKKLWAVYAGRWVKGKGLEVLVDTWERGAPLTGFQWGLILALADLKEIPAATRDRLERLRAHVRIVQNPPDLAVYYQASDLAVLLSQGEGLSNFLLESMASGLPLLTTPAAAVAPERASAWSWILSESTPESVLARLMAIQSDLASLTSRGAAALAEVEADYSLAIVAGRYEELYKEMIRVRNLRDR